ncbi:unnamed protein product [Rotaria socialis]|uniref:Uncharacterized protein n=1 Tax=Rotaria socialis TaxID=392032 RepID=A0A818B453_9BILA|nr:unnamed protein product [Rotaria socialis]CAF3328841.1 unnamed protein product [Rotaria socialis]CAF3415304.1 unnamed protein product [Rotaria socialis]CAF3611456.1 unnamed protein product [Rotaria socialis]CAF3718421.1 unnamed protein product [Rotaria socialis]
MPSQLVRRLSMQNDSTYSATEYRQRFLSPRREDYNPHAALPKLNSSRPPSGRPFLACDVDPKTALTSSEYRLCYENYHPKRPYVFHARPSHVFDHVPLPPNYLISSRIAINHSSLKDTEYQERFPNYPSFIPGHALLPPHIPSKPNTQSDTQLKRDHMSRSQYFDQLIVDSDKLNGGQRRMGTSEQRNAFQWPYYVSSSQQKTKREEVSTPAYQPYYVPRNIYEPLPTVQRSTVNGFN